jgi:hypothetical protein
LRRFDSTWTAQAAAANAALISGRTSGFFGQTKSSAPQLSVEHHHQ